MGISAAVGRVLFIQGGNVCTCGEARCSMAYQAAALGVSLTILLEGGERYRDLLRIHSPFATCIISAANAPRQQLNMIEHTDCASATCATAPLDWFVALKPLEKAFGAKW